MSERTASSVDGDHVMTTPRDAAVEPGAALLSVLAKWNSSGPAGDKKYDTYAIFEEDAPKIEAELLAALASPPAPETTLAELVDALIAKIEESVNRCIDIEYTLSCMERRDPNYKNTLTAKTGVRFKVSADLEELKKLALLAYQPPAPVSRAGAVTQVTDAMVSAAILAGRREGFWVGEKTMESALTAALAAAEGSA